MLWSELRQDEFLNAVEESKGVCILPIGCVEAHGIHLPLACDVMHAEAHCKLAAEREPVVVFPPIYFGEKAGAGEYPGTIIFPETLIHAILEQCCKEIYRNGFKKILIVSGHGGNSSLLNNFARSCLQKVNGYNVFVLSVDLGYCMPKRILEDIAKYPELTEADVEILKDYVDKNKTGGHGCFTETGWIYNTRPDLTRLDLMDKKDGRSRHVFDEFAKHKIYSPFGWATDHPDSLHGDYHEGLNERIAKVMSDRCVDQLSAAFKFLKEETVSDRVYEEWRKKNPLL